MAANTFGEAFRITTFGESHGKAVGVIVDGCPSGLHLCEQDIQIDLDRRRPGQSHITTQRNEADTVEILSGVFEGKTTGSPIAMIVFNKDHRSSDYEDIKKLYRPGHADYTFTSKFGHRDPRGGGRTSARIMIARVAAGAIAKKFLKEKFDIDFLAYTQQIGDISLENEPNYLNLEIETPRLILKPINFDFLLEMQAEFNENVAKYTLQKPASLQETAKQIHFFIQEIIDKTKLHFVVLDKNNQQFLGNCNLSLITSADEKPNVGLWLKESAQSQKYGQEIIFALKSWLDNNLDYEYILYFTDKNNLASRKIVENLHGKIFGIIKKTDSTGQKLELLEYRLYKNSDLLKLDEEILELEKIYYNLSLGKILL